MRRLLLACALLAPSVPAAAAPTCDANNLYTFDWNTQPDAFWSYASSYSVTATNPLGRSQAIGISFGVNGIRTAAVAGYGTPLVAAVNTGTLATNEKTLTVGGVFNSRTPDVAANTNVVATSFSLGTTAVRDVTFRIFDIDYMLNSYRDWVRIIGRHGANTYTATITRPAASAAKIGPTGTPQAIAAGDVLGTATSSGRDDIGTIVATFPQPVTSFEVRYGNYPLQTGETATGEQWISIHDLSFCPIPVVAVTKSSAPLATTGPDRFNTPGSDVVYTLTATNSGGSPVDASTLVLTDTLPANVTFYNGEFNAAAPGSGPIQLNAGASGVTLGAVTYSNGTSYGMTPAAGYDPAVKGVRVSLSGTMAANSTAIVRFRAQIK